MDILDEIVERRIADAMRHGEFDSLPGAGRPLELDDDSLVPPDLRVAYRLLKNAGYLPDELLLRLEVRSTERLLAQALAEEERTALSARLRLLLSRLGEVHGGSILAEAQYFDRLVERLGPCGPGGRGV